MDRPPTKRINDLVKVMRIRGLDDMTGRCGVFCRKPKSNGGRLLAETMKITKKTTRLFTISPDRRWRRS